MSEKPRNTSDPNVCCTCMKVLTKEEKERYYRDFSAWEAKHPKWNTYMDELEVSAFTTGCYRDCDSCAFRRLQREKESRDAPKGFDDFIGNAAQGGPEGFIIAGVIIFILVVIFLASAK